MIYLFITAIAILCFAVAKNERLKRMSKRLSLVLPDETVSEMEKRIDGVIIQNKSHLVSIAITEFLNKHDGKPKRDRKGRFA